MKNILYFTCLWNETTQIYIEYNTATERLLIQRSTLNSKGEWEVQNARTLPNQSMYDAMIMAAFFSEDYQVWRQHED